MYKPKFTTTDRDGMKALWVSMPNGEQYNIWDLQDDVMVEGVQEAIIHSFELGYYARSLQEQAGLCMEISSNKFERGD